MEQQAVTVVPKPEIGASMPSPSSTARFPSGLHEWRWRVPACLALLSAAVWITWDAWSDLAMIGFHNEQSHHVLAAPFAAAVLVLVRWRMLRGVRFEGFWPGPLLTAVGLVCWYAGYHHDMQLVWHAGAVLIAVGCFVTVIGGEVVRRLLPAFAVLVFLLPMPHTVRLAVAHPLMEVSANVTWHVADLLGMGVMQSGRTLRINGQDVTIAEACSGMRMIFTLFLACFVSAYTLRLREPVRWLILLAAPVVAVVANVVRLVITLWAYGSFSPEMADMLHNLAGWVMVLLAFVALEQTTRLLEWLGIPVYKRKAVRS